MSKDISRTTGTQIRTMEEFSMASGISRPTLSRFFNDPQAVRPSSRARIEEAMERLNYRPNLFALNFNRKSPKTLGILVPSLTDPFYAGLVQQIETLALDAGYWTILLSAQGNADHEAQAVSTLLSLKLAGAIVVPLGDSSRIPMFRELAAALPVVFLSTRIDVEGSYIGSDNDRSVALILDYLLRSGSAPVFFDMPEVNTNSRQRRLSYQRVMEEMGLEAEVISIPTVNWDFEKLAFDRATELFRQQDMAGRTILCANDRVAFGVMAAASETGLSIGRGEKSVRIAGNDDHPLARYTCPPLTTVAQDQSRLAELGLKVMLDIVNDGLVRNEVHQLDAKLVMRSSA